MAFETESWPVVKAKWFTKVEGKKRTVRLIVIHDMEFPERLDTAEVIAHDFATRNANNKASAHLCIDADSIIQCVLDNDVAYAAPGANSDGIHLELAGYGRQTREEWLDEYGKKLLARAADATAQYCLKYGIQPVHITNDQLKRGEKGIIGHVQASQVYKKSDHADPGPNFPWDYFMNLVKEAHQRHSRS